MGIFDLFKPNVEKMKEKNDVNGLIKALKYKKDSEVRQRAAEALGGRKDKSVIEPLIQALLIESKFGGYDSYSESTRKALKGALVEIGNMVVEPLIQALLIEWKIGGYDSDSERNREALKGALVEIGNMVVEPIIQTLRNENIPSVIEGSKYEFFIHDLYFVLGKLKDERAVEPLIHVLNNKSKSCSVHIRRDTAWTLGNIGDPRAIEPLIQALREDNVRISARDALVKIGNMAIEPLIQALKDEEKGVREKTAEALGMIKDKRAVEPLIQALKDKDRDVREKTAESLGMIKDERAIEPLIQALNDKDKDVREKTAEALRMIKDSKVIEPLIQALKVDFGSKIIIRDTKKGIVEVEMQMSEYREFFNTWAKTLMITDADVIYSKHQAFCASCGVLFTREALQHLYLFGPKTDFRGPITIMGASREGTAIRFGICPNCREPYMKVIII